MKKHLCGVCLLHCLTVDIEVQMKVTNIFYLCDRYPFPNYSRTVEALTKFPWQSLLFVLFEQFHGGEIHATGDGIIVSVCEPLWYALAKPTKSHHKTYATVHPT